MRRGRRFRLIRASGRRQFRERANVQHQFPSLAIGQAIFKAGHGPLSLADFVEEFAVGLRSEARGHREIRRFGSPERRIIAIAFAGITVAGGALLAVKGACFRGIECPRRNGILPAFCLRRDRPVARMKRGKAHDKNDGRKNRNEEDNRITAARDGRSTHSAQKSFAHREGRGKNTPRSQPASEEEQRIPRFCCEATRPADTQWVRTCRSPANIIPSPCMEESNEPGNSR